MNERTPTHELLRALRFAAGKHRDQRRKDEDSSPFINHPIAVAEILARFGITDLVTLQAAVLHDTLEDTETTADELERAFGPELRDVVVEVSDTKGLLRAERKAEQVRRAPLLSARAKLVRIADKIANIDDVAHNPPAWPLERRLEYLDWTEQVVAGCRGVNPDLEACYDRLLAEGREKLRS